MNRYLVIGPSGSGKTTVAKTIADRCGLPLIELDALYFGPNWVPRLSFEDEVATRVQSQFWVIDGNYPSVRELLWSRANVVVWLDLPRWLTEWRIVCRSLSRWIHQTELYGNREPAPIDFKHSVRGWFDARHPVRSAWKKHPQYQAEYEARFENPVWAHLDRIRLRSPSEIQAFIAALGSPDWWIRWSMGGGEWENKHE